MHLAWLPKPYRWLPTRAAAIVPRERPRRQHGQLPQLGGLWALGSSFGRALTVDLERFELDVAALLVQGDSYSA